MTLELVFKYVAWPWTRDARLLPGVGDSPILQGVFPPLASRLVREVLPPNGGFSGQTSNVLEVFPTVCWCHSGVTLSHWRYCDATLWHLGKFLALWVKIPYSFAQKIEQPLTSLPWNQGIISRWRCGMLMLREYMILLEGRLETPTDSKVRSGNPTLDCLLTLLLSVLLDPGQ